MRTHLVAGLALGVLVGALRADPGKDGTADRVARLIEQLGDRQYARREAAGRELEAVGEPALPALRRAAAGADDAEVRRRAEQVVGAIRRNLGKKELARWEGSWVGDPGVYMTIKGDRFTSGTPTVGARNGSITAVEVGEKVVRVDMLVEEGDTKGQTFRAIFRLDGDTLHSCGTYAAVRPGEFKSGGENYYIPWKRAKK